MRIYVCLCQEFLIPILQIVQLHINERNVVGRVSARESVPFQSSIGVDPVLTRVPPWNDNEGTYGYEILP